MQLAVVQYEKDSSTKQYIVILLAESEDKYSCLLSSDLSEEEIRKIRSNINKLDDYEIGERIGWLRNNIGSYNKAYREFKKSKARIDQFVPIKPVGEK